MFQQDLHAYADNLIYDVRLRMDVEDRIAEKFFWCVDTFFWKKLKDINLVLDGLCWDHALNFEFSKISINLKSDSHLAKNFVLFDSLIAFPKWWKMLFISS